MTYKLSFNCKKCNTKQLIEAKEGMFGKKNTFRCRQCSELISVKIPDEKVLISRSAKINKTNSNVETETLINTNSKTETYLKIQAVKDDKTKSQSFDIDQKRMTIGRKNQSGPAYKPDIEIETADRYMSKKHALIIRKENKEFVISDLNSTNGTWLNGQKLNPNDEEYLEDGDEIKIGRTHFKIKTISSSANSSSNSNKNYDNDETIVD